MEHHDASGFPRPNLQKLGSTCLGPTSGIPQLFLCSNQENKKCVRLGNLFNACSYVKTLTLMRSKMFAKSVQPKSSYVVVVQVVGVYQIVHYVRALGNPPCHIVVIVYTTRGTTNLAIQRKSINLLKFSL
jgi:hypothetical protein